MPDRIMWKLLILLILILAGAVGPAGPAQAQLFYCPDRSVDQQYTAEPEPGCVPLVEEDKERRSRRDDARPGAQSPPPVDLTDLQGNVMRFLERYNQFVSCCADDSYELERVDDLSEEADRLLDAAQRGMSSALVQARGMTLRELMDPVTRASRNLKELAARLQRLQALREQLFVADYEAAGRVRLTIAEEEDAIRRRFQPIKLPEWGRTGTGIQDTSVPATVGEGGGSTVPAASGEAFGSPEGEADSLGSRSGTGIGRDGSSGSNIGQTPSTGFGIGGSAGPTGESSLPSSAGPNIGE